MEQTNYNTTDSVQKDTYTYIADTVTLGNRVVLDGQITTDLVVNHSTHGESFYAFTVSSRRLNNEVTDDIPVEISERVVDVSNFNKGDFVRVTGQFRSYNKYDEESDKVRLKLFIFAREMEHSTYTNSKKNNISLTGYVCKKPIFRRTPYGREICDIILAVSRMYKKTDYIPCIAWSRNARFLSKMGVGSKIEIEGRIQSRNYRKKLSDNENDYELRTVYEVSISSIVVLEEQQEREEIFDSPDTQDF